VFTGKKAELICCSNCEVFLAADAKEKVRNFGTNHNKSYA